MLLATLLQFHAGWAWVLIFGNGLAGVWSLAAHKVLALRTRALFWFIGFVETAVFIQVLTGVIMVSSKAKSPPVFHPFYGFVAIIVIGFLYAYKDRLVPRLYLLYGFGSLFLMGVSIRALLVAIGG